MPVALSTGQCGDSSSPLPTPLPPVVLTPRLGDFFVLGLDLYAIGGRVVGQGIPCVE